MRSQTSVCCARCNWGRWSPGSRGVTLFELRAQRGHLVADVDEEPHDGDGGDDAREDERGGAGPEQRCAGAASQERASRRTSASPRPVLVLLAGRRLQQAPLLARGSQRVQLLALLHALARAQRHAHGLAHRVHRNLTSLAASSRLSRPCPAPPQLHRSARQVAGRSHSNLRTRTQTRSRDQTSPAAVPAGAPHQNCDDGGSRKRPPGVLSSRQKPASADRPRGTNSSLDSSFNTEEQVSFRHQHHRHFPSRGSNSLQQYVVSWSLRGTKNPGITTGHLFERTVVIDGSSKRHSSQFLCAVASPATCFHHRHHDPHRKKTRKQTFMKPRCLPTTRVRQTWNVTQHTRMEKKEREKNIGDHIAQNPSTASSQSVNVLD